MQLWLVLLLLLSGWYTSSGVQLSEAKLVDPYKTLGVAKKATDEEIKQAYRNLAKKYHPDKNKSKHATAKFLEVQEAYDVLSSADKRQRWDAGQGDGSGGGTRHSWYEHQGAHRWQWPRDEPSYDHVLPSETVTLTRSNLANSVLYRQVPWLIQVYTYDNPACKKFARAWEALHKATSSMRDGLSQPLLSMGRVNWRFDHTLANWVANNRVFGGDVLTWDSLPVVFAVPAECAQSECFIRYRGPMTMSSLQDFVADKLLKWPPIPHVELGNLDVMLHKVHPAKVIALAFTKSDGQGSLQLRRLAQTQQGMMTFGLVSVSRHAAASTDVAAGSTNNSTAELLQQWSLKLGVADLKPSTLVLLRGPGASPLVLPVTPTNLEATIQDRTLMWQALPALRLRTIDPLGCRWGAAPGNSFLQGDFVVSAKLCVVAIAHDRGVLDRARANMLRLGHFLQQPAQQPPNLRKQLKQLGQDVGTGQVRLTWMDASTHHAFCHHHFSAHAAALMPMPGMESTEHARMQRMAAAVCGRTWWEWLSTDLVGAAKTLNSNPFTVRAAVSQMKQATQRAAVLAYRPTQPGVSSQVPHSHLFALFTEADLGAKDFTPKPEQLAHISKWLSSCLAAAATSAPPWRIVDPLMVALNGSPAQLMPDDEPGAMEFVVDRIIHGVRVTVATINACFSSGNWAPELQLVASLVATGLVLLIVHLAMSTQHEQQRQQQRTPQPDVRYEDVDGAVQDSDGEASSGESDLDCSEHSEEERRDEVSREVPSNGTVGMEWP